MCALLGVLCVRVRISACAYQCVYVCVTEGNELCADWMWAVYAFAGCVCFSFWYSTDRPISRLHSTASSSHSLFLFAVSVIFSLFWGGGEGILLEIFSWNHDDA